MFVFLRYLLLFSEKMSQPSFASTLRFNDFRGDKKVRNWVWTGLRLNLFQNFLVAADTKSTTSYLLGPTFLGLIK